LARGDRPFKKKGEGPGKKAQAYRRDDLDWGEQKEGGLEKIIPAASCGTPLKKRVKKRQGLCQ